jgi:hypothetical protein
VSSISYKLPSQRFLKPLSPNAQSRNKILLQTTCKRGKICQDGDSNQSPSHSDEVRTTLLGDIGESDSSEKVSGPGRRRQKRPLPGDIGESDSSEKVSGPGRRRQKRPLPGDIGESDSSKKVSGPGCRRQKRPLPRDIGESDSSEKVFAPGRQRQKRPLPRGKAQRRQRL